MYEWYFLWINALEVYIGTFFLCPFYPSRVHTELCSSIVSWYKPQLASQGMPIGSAEAYADC